MRKNLLAGALAMLLAGACLAAEAPAQKPPAGGVVISPELLQQCAAEGGCLMISRARLTAIEAAAMLQGALYGNGKTCARPPAPGVSS